MDFGVPWNRTAPVEIWLVPPGVVTPFSKQAAAMPAEMAQQLSALHRARASSS